MINVLIADDDVDSWFCINALLRRYFIKASFVTNLKAARQYIDIQTPSLLFFDKELQKNSAFDFIKDVRAKYPRAKVIMVNPHEENSIRSRSGADLVISKPLIPEMIERAIVKLLDA